ncbi:MAG TPA: class I SAM-dependent methyltransferase [Methanomassiliicoccales archaeon]|nr:class I SAM-dependent methyltransferase [Methanomassiliicoccales archaeon]
MTAVQASIEEDKRTGMLGERHDTACMSSLDYRSLADSITAKCGDLLSHGGTVMDLSCGKGELTALLLPSAGGVCHFVAFDANQENVDECQDRFRWLAHQGFVQVSNRSLASDLPCVANSLTIEEFGLGGLDEHRISAVLSQSKRALQKGGAIILMERNDRSWIELLREAGFREAERIWRRGPFEALLAVK